MKLIPADKQQCQTIKTFSNPWSFGIQTRQERCTAKPTVVIKEKKKGSDGKRGSMSLCKECLKLAKQQLGNTIEIRKIK